MTLSACNNSGAAARCIATPTGPSWTGRLRRRLLGISEDEVTLARRGIRPATPVAGQRLERIGWTFVQGYHAALAETDAESLSKKLNQFELELRGFAFEGAAMGLYLLDRLTTWRRNRFKDLLAGAGERHVYMMYVGAGWALARLRRRPAPLLAEMDPLMRWLAVDGLAFHEAYFHPRRTVEDQVIPDRLKGYERNAFDQGLGRGMWFALGADVRRIVDKLGALAAARQSDAWSGVGLAAAYAGGVAEGDIERLGAAAGPFAAEIAQGAAFAAKCRERAGNPAAHTECACRILCGVSAEEAAAATDDALAGLPPEGAEPRFEVWRQRIQERFRR